MMTKGTMIFLVLAGCIACGMRLMEKEKKKILALEELERILALLQGRITYGAGEMGGILRELRDSTQYFAKFFGFLSQKIEKRQGESLQELWEMGMQREKMDFLERETRELLREFGGVLGRFDRKTQINSIEIYRQRLERILRKAREQEEQKRKLYRVTSVVAGCFLSILIL